MNTLTIDDITTAADQLATTRIGRAMLLTILKAAEAGDDLDAAGKDAALTLILSVWGRDAGPTREAMRTALDPDAP